MKNVKYMYEGDMEVVKILYVGCSGVQSHVTKSIGMLWHESKTVSVHPKNCDSLPSHLLGFLNILTQFASFAGNHLLRSLSKKIRGSSENFS